MEKIKRYTFSVTEEYLVRMDECKDGDFVKFSDYITDLEFVTSDLIIQRECYTEVRSALGLEMGQDTNKAIAKLQSDKQTLLEALKEARNEIHDLTFITTDEFSAKTSALQDAKDSVKKYDDIIKSVNT